MISQRAVTRMYALMLKNGSLQGEVDSNRLNIYTCSKCGEKTITIDRDNGVTSFQIPCPKCNETAVSHFYKNIPKDAKPTWEWYRPTEEQCKGLRKQEALLDHIFNGGLVLRKMK